MMKLTSSHLGSGRGFKEDKGILSRIQALVGYGYKRCSRHCYFIKIDNTQKASLSVLLSNGTAYIDANVLLELQKLQECIPSLRYTQAKAGLDIGFTFQGLAKLKVKTELLEVFRKKSPAFFDNAFIRATQHLGDTGESSPQHWQQNFQVLKNQASFDLVLIVHVPIDFVDGKSVENLNYLKEIEACLLACLIKNEPRQTLKLPSQASWIERSMPLDNLGTEHFGYQDGITSPVYSVDAHAKDDMGYRKVHALGEILLGHAKNDGDNPYADLDLTKKANPYLDAQPEPREEIYKDFFKDSSFAVLRKLEQRVDVFNQWVKQSAQDLVPQDAAMGITANRDDPYALAKRWVKSKIMGRTPEGLLLTPDMRYKDMQETDVLAKVKANEASKVDINDFRFHQRDNTGRTITGDDSQGIGCPFSSHIRRMNPRDDAVTPFIHRPLLRRGLPYEDGVSKGLFGVFFCADIAEQFEHLAGAWGQHRVMGTPDRSFTRDPILGQHEPEANKFFLDIPNQQAQHRAAQFSEPFVVTRGCAYTWFPSIDTLNNLQKYQSSP